MDQGSIKPEMFRLHARQARTIDSADDISREATLDRTDKISCALSAFYDACHSFQLNQLDGHGVIKVNRSNGAHPPFFDPTARRSTPPETRNLRTRRTYFWMHVSVNEYTVKPLDWPKPYGVFMFSKAGRCTLNLK